MGRMAGASPPEMVPRRSMAPVRPTPARLADGFSEIANRRAGASLPAVSRVHEAI